MSNKLQNQAEKLHTKLDNAIEHIEELKKELGEFTKTIDGNDTINKNNNNCNNQKK